MSGFNAPWFLQQFDDPNTGKPLSGGKLYFYYAGSTDIPKPTYIDYAQSNESPNPLILDPSGVAPEYFMGPGGYKVKITRADGSLVWTRDNISGTDSAGSIAGATSTGERESFPESRVRWIEADSGTLWNNGMCFCWIFSAKNYTSLKWVKSLFGGTSGVASGRYSIWGFQSLTIGASAPVKLHDAVLPDATSGTLVGIDYLGLDVTGYAGIGIAMDPGVYGPGQPIEQAALLASTAGPSFGVRPSSYLANHVHNTSFSDWPEPVSSDPAYRITKWISVGISYKTEG